MGHIALAVPVAHVWFFKGAPSRLSLLLDVSPRALEGVLYFAQYLVTSVNEEEKKSVMKRLSETGKMRIDEVEKRISSDRDAKKEQYAKEKEALKEKISNVEARTIAGQELAVKERKDLSKLDEQISNEAEKIKAIVDSLLSIVRSIKPLTTLTEDEYLRLLEYDAASCFTVDM